jgi:DNA-binding protein WhiA
MGCGGGTGSTVGGVQEQVRSRAGARVAAVTVWGSVAKDEICAHPVAGSAARAAEAAAMLRFTDAVQVSSRGVRIEATVDCVAVARRLRTTLRDVFDCATDGWAAPAGPRGGFVVHVVATDDVLARRAGLLSPRRQLVTGLPAGLLAGDLAVVEAVWRGAFLARGALSSPTRPPVLSVACPALEAAVALVGGARRLGATVALAESRGRIRVVARHEDDMGLLMTRIGARRTFAGWVQDRDEHRRHRAVTARTTPATYGSLQNSNQARALRAAGVTTDRVRRALLLLGEDVPEHLAAAARLRIDHPEVSLDALGALADPVLTKDAIAGRLRRLLSTADRHAQPPANPPPTPPRHPHPGRGATG